MATLTIAFVFNSEVQQNSLGLTMFFGVGDPLEDIQGRAQNAYSSSNACKYLYYYKVAPMPLRYNSGPSMQWCRYLPARNTGTMAATGPTLHTFTGTIADIRHY